MSAQPPVEPPQPDRDVAPPVQQADVAGTPAQGPESPEKHGHVGPWILAAAVVLVLGVLGAVLIHEADTSDTQTVVTPTVNTTTVQRSAPTVTQATTNVTPATTVTAPTQTKTVTVEQPKTTTEPTTTTP